MKRSDVRWTITSHADRTFRSLREEMGEEEYWDEVEAMREAICQYINAGGADGAGCTHKALQISPCGGAPHGGKALKMRWSHGGGGKSGGLRVALVAFCEEFTIALAGAWVRRDASAEEFDGAIATTAPPENRAQPPP